MKRKLFQFRFRTWRTLDSGSQIALLPHLSLWWSDVLDDKFDPTGKYVYCLAFGWLFWYPEVWINAFTELI